VRGPTTTVPAGSRRAGTGRHGQARAGTGRHGQARAGTGRHGQARAGTGSVPAGNQFSAIRYDTPCPRAHPFNLTRTA
jgi:hypothetical protein